MEARSLSTRCSVELTTSLAISEGCDRFHAAPGPLILGPHFCGAGVIDDPKSKILIQERQETDESLDAEREKTDEFLERQAEALESETDTALQKARRMTDQSRETVRKGSSSVDRESVNETVGKAIEVERKAVDAAVEDERDAKQNSINRIVSEEREITDKNLSNERAITDLQVKQSVHRLVAEKIAHAKTKVVMTTREEFLAIVSHDLRNPIGAISSCTDLLLEDPALQNASAETLQWIDLIRRNAETSLRLIGDLLDMERIAQDRLYLHLEQQDMTQIIQECIDNHKHLAKLKSIDLQFIDQSKSDAAEDVQKTQLVSCDRDRMLQLLSNLLGNAIKFTPEGGRVTVTSQIKDLELLILVRDTGPGISEAERSHIFERFAQIKNKDRRGLGLGLFISKMLAELHLGSLRVESTPGQGSCFTITIPIGAVS